jgi:hypothetical protein
VAAEVGGHLHREPRTGERQRVAHGDGPAVGVDLGAVERQPEVVEERDALHGEGLVHVDDVDVVDGRGRSARAALGGGDRAVAHRLGLDADERVVDQRIRRGEPELVDLGREASSTPPAPSFRPAALPA